MKRILLLALSLILVFSLVACGGNGETSSNAPSADQVESKGNTDADDPSASGENTDSTPAGDQNASSEDAGGTPTVDDQSAGGDAAEPTFIGTWGHERTDAEPFPLTLTIKADGTVEWKESRDKWVWTDNGDGTIEISTPDAVGYGDDAYLTDDGKLVWKTSLGFGENNTIEQVTLERQ